MIKKECHECHGKKIINSLEEMTLFIEKGMENGREIKFEEFGEEKPDKDPGHLIFIFEELPDKIFKREKDNLRVDMFITLKEALIGFEKEIIHLDRHKFPLKKILFLNLGKLLELRKKVCLFIIREIMGIYLLL